MTVLPRTTLLLAISALASMPLAAVPYYLGVDVPAALGGTDYLPTHLVRKGASYSLSQSLPADQEIAAVHLTPGGTMLLSFRSPVTIGGVEVEPCDVVERNGSSYTLVVDGSAEGIPAEAAIDALAMTADGRLLLSFDVAVTLGGTPYGPGDIALRTAAGSFLPYFDGAAAGVPPEANVVGVDETGTGELVFSFDAPVTLGAATYLPGDLVRRTSGTFTLHDRDPGWPPYARMADFSFTPSPGSVPDGDTVPGTPLSAVKSGGAVALSWGAACRGAATDYEAHSMQVCSNALMACPGLLG